MVFVLYLAGLAVLIVVLALGLEFVQRRGAPAVSSPLRQEPVVAPRTPALTPTGGASPSLASGAAASAAPPPAPVVARTGAVREIVLIVAVALLALIALGSDWVFYRQLDEMRAARRAWLAPQSARSDKAPAVGRTFEVSVLTQNSGAEPAVDIFADAAPFAVALSDAGSPSVDRSIRDALNHCLATKPGDRTRVVYRTFVSDPSRRGRGAGGALDRVEQEDEAVVEQVQKGIRSRLYERGRYSPSRETGVHHFHRLLAGMLA